MESLPILKHIDILKSNVGSPCGASIKRDFQFPEQLVYAFTLSFIHLFIQIFHPYLSQSPSKELSKETEEYKQSPFEQPHVDGRPT